ncbi:MAG: GNAT family N-acetyltransferase [Cyclobacteriaceae bacterium]
MSINIRPVTIADANQLRSLAEITFSQTFEVYNSPGDFQQYLDDNLNLEKLKTELQHPHSFFYFAEYDESIAGYIKINIKEAQGEEIKDGLELERIYVLAEFHRAGIGQQLMNFTLEKAKALDCRTVWLGVWKKNKAAISFYEKNGFSEFGSHVFMLGKDEQTDLLFKRDV